MLNVAFREIWSRKRRLVGTSLAVVLGVALLAGTLVLGSTLESSFDDLFDEAAAGTGVVVRSTLDVGGDDQAPTPLPADVVDTVASVDGVAAAVPTVEGYGQLISADGAAIGGNGPPTLAGNWIENEHLNPYRLVEGRPPTTTGEVIINRGAAKTGHLALGDTTTVRTPDPRQVKIVGIATFGSADGLGPTTFTGFTLEAAQEFLMRTPDQVTGVLVQSDEGISDDELAERIGDVLPGGAEAITGTELSDENLAAIGDDFLDLFRNFLLVFAGIALFVATFSIHNTFSITAAQRTREAALLRAIGATRRQIVTSMLVEALAVGLAASVLGLLSGLAIAAGLQALFRVLGMPLPGDGGLTISAGDLLVAAGVGLTVTLVAGLTPAIRSSRVAPLAALRGAAVESAPSVFRRGLLGALFTMVGVGLLVAGASGSGGLITASGAVVTLAGLVVVGPVIAATLASVIERPLAALRGITGRLAAQNARRNPRRTAGTATALMIGVGIVTLITVVIGSLQVSTSANLERSLTAEVVVSTGQFGASGFSSQLADDLTALPDVATAVGLGGGQALVDGESRTVTAADPAALRHVIDVGDVEGTLDTLGSQEIALSKTTADADGLQVGDVVPVTFADGTSTDLRIAATYEDTTLVGNQLMGTSGWEPHASQQIDRLVLVQPEEGVPVDQALAAVDRLAEGYGDPQVQTRSEYIVESTSMFEELLGVVYVLLALAIIIALIGIANTLSLSVYERLREIGLLRAVGQTQGQVRSMIRWESVLIALFGTLVGVGLGVLLAWSFVNALATDTFPTSFDAPLAPLVVIAVVGAAAGMVAAIRPARRAARLDVLEAVTAD